MRAILIDPKARSITETDYNGDYKHIYKLIECEPSPFTMVQLSARESLFLDDEGLFKGHTDFFMWKGYSHPLCGKGLILGIDYEGESVATKLKLDFVTKQVSWHRKQVLGFEDTEGKGELFGKRATVLTRRTIYKDLD
jgi:hypothetical protein